LDLSELQTFVVKKDSFRSCWDL